MSAMCAMHSANPTSRPSWNRGDTTATSFKWPMIHHGLLVISTSPGASVDRGKTFRSSFTAIEVVPTLEAMLTSAASIHAPAS